VVQEALTRVSERGFDVVVCWAEQPDELAAVIRIRKASPDLPIVLLTRQNDSTFLDLGLQAGATRVLGLGADLGAASKSLQLALETKELAQQAKALAMESRHLAREVRESARQTSQLAQDALGLLVKQRKRAFIPLLIEDSPDDAFLMVKAFDRAEVFAPLPILKSGEQAVAYLSGRCFYKDRSRYPLPSLVILDIHLPRRSGFDVLAWIRKQPELRRLPVVMLSGSAERSSIDRAYQLGVNSYLVKPTTFDGLVELVRGLGAYWSGLNQPHDRLC
jgi:CheY-like chemotaxis protein